MDNYKDKMDSSAVYTMFEELKDKIDEQPKPITPAVQRVEIGNITELNDAVSKLEAVAGVIRKPQEHIHRHTIDLMSKWGLIAYGMIMTVIIILTWKYREHKATIGKYSDNDLKYRYIEMRGHAKPEDVLMLRNVFEFNRNADSIRMIRQRVEKYERLIKEEAETRARVSLNSEEAERLRQEAENVKVNK